MTATWPGRKVRTGGAGRRRLYSVLATDQTTLTTGGRAEGCEGLPARTVKSWIACPTLLEAYTLVLFRLGETAAMRWLEEMAGAAGQPGARMTIGKRLSEVQSLGDQSSPRCSRRYVAGQ